MPSNILFLSAVRNRSASIVESIGSIVSAGFGRLFDFLVIQDLDKDNLSKGRFDPQVFNSGTVGRIRIVNVEVGGVFNKCLLLNHGIRHSTHRFVVQQDSDILFCRQFLLAALKVCEDDAALSRLIVTCKYVEMRGMVDFPFRKAGQEAGRTLLLFRPHVEAVGGYDEQIGMGNEEWDLTFRLKARFGLRFLDLDRLGFANLHMTHGGDTRVPGIFGMINRNFEASRRNIAAGLLVANSGGWGVVKPPVYVEDVV